MVVLVSGGLSEGARPFPLRILDTKISVNSTSGECIRYLICHTCFVAPLVFALGKVFA